MSEFEFFFSLFGLLLGFSLVEVLGGLARAIEAALHGRRAGKKTFRAGWLTPLLGIFVLLDILSFWAAAWTVRGQIDVSGAFLFAGLAFASAYYLAAHLVFPGDLATAGDLDDHYFRVRRVVFGGLIALALIQIVWFATLPGIGALLARPYVAGMSALLIVLMAAAMLVRGRAASAILLGALILRYLVAIIF
jgi:hypothetical protein